MMVILRRWVPRAVGPSQILPRRESSESGDDHSPDRQRFSSRPTPDTRSRSLACELQRDWARVETVPAIVEIVLADRLLKE